MRRSKYLFITEPRPEAKVTQLTASTCSFGQRTQPAGSRGIPVSRQVVGEPPGDPQFRLPVCLILHSLAEDRHKTAAGSNAPAQQVAVSLLPQSHHLGASDGREEARSLRLSDKHQGEMKQDQADRAFPPRVFTPQNWLLGPEQSARTMGVTPLPRASGEESVSTLPRRPPCLDTTSDPRALPPAVSYVGNCMHAELM